MNPVHFSSETVEHATPQDLFDALNAEYGFTLDPCATAQNAKCAKFYTREDDGLSKSWADEIVFMNPPYGDAEQPCRFTGKTVDVGFIPVKDAKLRTVTTVVYYCTKRKCAKRGYHVSEYIPGIADWIRKAYESARQERATVVCLLPARTDTKYWHTYIWDKWRDKPRHGVRRLRFIEGRLKFGDAKASAPFPSAVVVFDFKLKVPRRDSVITRSDDDCKGFGA